MNVVGMEWNAMQWNGITSLEAADMLTSGHPSL